MILLIDNYDSFTYNLYQLLGTQAPRGTAIKVIRNDAEGTAALGMRRPDHVVLSPGPGHPATSALSLAASDLFPTVPLLGVCLGHQALALAHGAQVARAPRPTHGRPISVRHDGSPLFEGLPAAFDAALYHSLAVVPTTLATPLAGCAWTEHGDIMALRHESRPHFGFQFHPESFMTHWGPRLLRNFLNS